MKNKKLNIKLVCCIIGFCVLTVVVTVAIAYIDANSAEKGDYFYEQGDYDQAIKHYTRAIMMNFWNKEEKSAYLSSRGLAYGLKGEWDKAIKDITEAINLFSDNIYDYNYNKYEYIVSRGDAYLLKEDYDLAILDYNRAISDIDYLIKNVPLSLNDDNDLLYLRNEAVTGKNYAERLHMRTVLENSLPGTKEYSAEAHYQRGLMLAYNLEEEIHMDIITRILEMFSGIHFPSDVDRAIMEWEEALRMYPDHIEAQESIEKAAEQKTHAKMIFEPLFAQNTDPRWDKWNADMTRDITHVGFSGIFEYFLFRVDKNAGETTISNTASFHMALVKYLENIFEIDYNSIREIENNTDLNNNVKRLMAKHGANVSVTFIGPYDNGAITVIINMDASTSRKNAYAFIGFDIYRR